MKKLVLLFSALFFGATVFAQTVLYHENFELPSGHDSVISTGDALVAWAQNDRIAAQGQRCDSNFVQVNDTTILQTQAFNCTGLSNVVLTFSHICKVAIPDGGEIFISVNNGPWIKLTTEYINPGNSQFPTMTYRFNVNTYPIDWLVGDPTAKPENSWWKHETFDISALAGNQANVRIGFALRDGNGIADGGYHGWFIDNIRVLGAISELIPPTITFLPPIIEDTLSFTGPFDIHAHITDDSGIDTAWLTYTVNGGPNLYIPMTWVSDSTYLATIPSYTWNTSINYFITAVDGSLSQNTTNTSIKHFFIEQGPNLVTIGTGTSTSSYPFYTLYEDARTQMIYTVAEITAAGGTAGLLTEIAFNIASAASQPMAGFNIRMQNTTLGTLTAYVDTGWTVVYTGTYTVPGTGWRTIELQSPFYWDGTSNLHIEICFDNDSYGSSSTVYSSTNSDQTWSRREDDMAGCSLTGGAAQTTRPNIRLSLPAINFEFDAGITQIHEPTGVVIANTNLPVIVTLKNFANDTLEKVTIKWTLDGAPMADFDWIGVMPGGVASLPFTIATVNVADGPHSIVVWTENPNDSLDQNMLNDTAMIDFYACDSLLNGVYTIGATGDFVDFNAALNKMLICGIDGPVVFNVQTDIYNEQLSIPEIPGASAVNTVTFQSASGNPADVTLTYTATGTADNYVLDLDGADHLRFNNITFEAGATDYARVLTVGNVSTQNIFNGNQFVGAATTSSTSTNIAVIYSSSGTTSQDSANTFINNIVQNGSYGMYWYGPGSTTLEKNTVILNNNFINQHYRGMVVYYQDSPRVEENTVVSSPTSSTTFYGIQTAYGDNALRILKNNVTLQQSGYGIYIYYCDGASGNEGLVANNMVSVGTGSGTTYGLSSYYSNFQKIYHNSVNVRATGTTARACYQYNGGNLEFANNIFAYTGTGTSGLAFYASTPAAILYSDYNDLYSTGTNLGYWSANRADLAAWQAASLKDSNSVSADPGFFTPTNLHTFSPVVSNAGTPIAIVTTDIDGDARNPLTPDIGADEFDIPATEARLLSVEMPVNSCIQTATEDVTIKIINNGTAPLTNLHAWYVINNGTPVHEVIAGPVPSLDTLTYTFTTQANLSAFGTYTFDFYINHPQDANLLNDTILDYTIYSGYDFTLGAYTQSFEDTEFFGDWSVLNVLGDNSKWVPGYAGTPRTGSNSARFQNATGTNPGNDWLFSRCFPLVGGETYEISYWYRGASLLSASKLNLKYGLAPDPAAMTYLLDSMPNILSLTYVKSTKLFVAPATGVYYFGWYAYANPTSTNHMYIDDINIKYFPPQEATLVSIESPVTGCGLSNAEQVTLQVLNSGSDNINGNFTAFYSVNGETPVSEAVSTLILPGDTLAFTFTTTIDMSVTTQDSTFNIVAWLALTGDPYSFNDTVATEVGSLHVPADPTVVGDTVIQNYPATLFAFNGLDSVYWYVDSITASYFHIGQQYITPPLTDTVTYYVAAKTGSADLKITEFQAYEYISGGGTNPAPSWIIGDDQIEITNLGSGSIDMLDYRLEVYGEGARTYTIPSFTLISGGIAVFHVGSGTDNPTNNFYNMGGSSNTISSSEASGFVLKDPSGSLVDAMAVNGYTFIQGTSGVSPADWSGNISSSSSKAGVIRTVSDNNLASDWVVSGTPSPIQTFGALNPGLNAGSGSGGCSSARVPVTAYVIYPPEDLAMIEILSPVDGCSDGTEDVTVIFFNNGIDTIQNQFTLGYFVSGNPVPTTEVINTDMLPGDTLLYTFATPAVMPINGNDTTYEITVFGANAGDIYFANDTSFASVNLQRTPADPVVQHDTILFGNTATLYAFSPDSIYWYIDDSIANHFHEGQMYQTPILFDTTTYYVEASTSTSVIENVGWVNGGTGTFITQTVGWGLHFNVTQEIVLDYVHVYPTGTGTITIHILDGSNNILQSSAPFALSGSGSQKIQVPVNLSILPGSYKIGMSSTGITNLVRESSGSTYPYVSPSGAVTIVSGATGTGTSTSAYYWFYDWGVIVGAKGCSSNRVPVTAYVIIPAEDIAVEAIYTPVDGCTFGVEDVTIMVKNYGYDTIQNPFTLGYFISGNPVPTTEVVNYQMLPGDTVVHTFATPAVMTVLAGDSTYQIKAFGANPGDIYFADDTLVKTVTLIFSPLAPTVTDATVPYATQAILQAASPYSISWFDVPAGGTEIDTGSTYTTPILFADETYYVEASTMIPGGFTIIGNGTTASYSAPTNGLYDYSWSSQLFTSSELGFSGQIDTIGVYVGNTPANFNLLDQRIYMSHVPYSSFTTASPPVIAGMTQVFTGNIIWNGGGWYKIALQTPFVYDGTSTLEIAWQNWDGDWVSGYPTFRYTTTTVNMTKYDYEDGSFPTVTGLLTMNRPNFYFGHATPGCPSPRVPVHAYITGQPNLDAGVTAITEPAAQTSLGIKNIKAVIRNYGLDTLTSVTVNWTVNGVAQPAFSWGGSLPTGAVDTAIIGTFDFIYYPYPGILHDIVAWTSQPNGGTDFTAINDTAMITVDAHDPYNGVYYIQTLTPDFPDFTTAVLGLSDWGVSGQVTILAESGTYTEQISIPPIPGASGVNTVTFASQTGVNTDVVLQFAANGTANNFVVRLNAADYIGFRDMTIKSSTLSTYGRVVELMGGASYNRFEDNIIKSVPVTSSNAAGVYCTSSGVDNFNQFIGNRIIDGYYGIYFYGSSSNRKTGNQFVDNVIAGWHYYGIYCYYQDSASIIGNTFANGAASAANYHIYAGYWNNGGRIEMNKIHGTGTGTFYGIYAYNHNASTTVPNTIANNFISQTGGSGTAYGMYLSSSNYVNIYFNSVNIAGGTATGGRAIYQTGGTSNVNIKNNNLANTGGGYAYYVNTPAAIAASDYNNLYASGTALAYWTAIRADLAALQTASSKDANSKSVPPDYYSVSDLHTAAIDLYHTGTPAGGILTDIDGDARNVATPCIGADEFVPPPVDAGIVSIDAPLSPVGAGPQAIVVTLKNYGLDTLTSVTIAYDVDGVPGTPYTWTGSLASGYSEANIIIDSFIFAAGIYDLRAWTELPNGAADPQPANDTAYSTLVACGAPLSGTYTLGGIGADFNDFTEAVITLQACGISAPVIFNVNSGTYEEQISIPEIPGATPINTITFQSATGVNTDVTLKYPALGTADNYVVRLDGGDFFIFRNMTIESTTPTTYGRVIVLQADALANAFENNIIRSVAVTSSNAAGIYSGSGSGESFNIFTGNRIENGYYGIYFYASSSIMKEYNEFIDNEVVGWHYYGIYNYYGLAPVVSGNTVTNGTSSGITYPIYLSYCDDGVLVEKNKVYGNGSSSFYGIYMSYCDGLAGSHNKVVNNFISQAVGTGTAYGLYVSGNTYTDVYYNSVHITGGSAAGGRALYQTGGSNIRIVNNILMNSGGGYAYYVGTPTAVVQSDYNDIYTVSGNYAWWTNAVANLAALQGNSSKDVHSISDDPGFIGTPDLHVSGPAVNGLALPITGITADIDGDIRNITTPDIGADEYTPLPWDIAVTAILLPSKSYGPVGAQDTVRVEIRNLGVNTVTTFGIHYQYAGQPLVSASWTGNLAPNQTTVYTFTTYISNVAGTESLCAFTTLIGDGDLSNDTLCKNHTGVPVLIVPYSTDFEANNYFYGDGPFETWEYGVPAATTINTAHTPVNCWATNLDGNYMNSSNEFLYSPYFNFTQAQNGILEFWHWYDTESGDDGGNVQYSLNGGNTWITLGYVGDPNSTNWYNQTIGGTPYFTGSSAGWVFSSYNLASIPAIVNATIPVQFRFRFYSDVSANSYDGWAVDDFAIRVPDIPKDAGVTAIVDPSGSTVTGSSVTVEVTLKNFGSDTLQSIPVAYRINNGAQTLQTWTGLLQPDSTVNFTFTTPYVAPGTAYTLCAFTKKSGDTYKFNDTTCMSISALPAPMDAGVTAILAPGTTTIANDSVQVQIRIRNFGTGTLTSIPLGYKRNGIQIATATWTGSLAGGDSIVYTFAQKYVSPLSNYSLCAYSMLPGDANPSNDEVCIYPEGVIGIGEYNGDGFYLWQNMPNPSADKAIIAYSIPAAGAVKFELHDLTGRIIYAEEQQRSAGLHHIELDVYSLSTGVYYYSVEFDGKRLVKKMLVNR